MTARQFVTFVLRMAWRETRATWLRLVFFFLCVGIGVAAIVTLRSVAQEVRGALTREARATVAADIVVQSTRPFPDDVRARIQTLGATAGMESSLQLVDTQTMAAGNAADSPVRLVELRAVEPGYPYYGAIELADGLTYSHDLLRDGGAVVQPELLVFLGLRVGDTFRMAGASFTVRGVITRDRMQRGEIAFGPRVYADLATLQRSSLLGFGSRATYQMLLKVAQPDNTAPLTETLRANLEGEFVRVRSWQTTEERIGRNLDTAENYLGLVGFAIVVIGGIGVWSVTRVLVHQRIRSVAVLKCLGASGPSVLVVTLTQVLGLALVGSLTGLALSAIVLGAIPASVLDPLGVSRVALTPAAAFQGTAVGMLVSLLFALVPLLDIRRIKPLLLLRGQTSGQGRPDLVTWFAGGLTAALLMVVTVWQAGEIETGLYVAGGFGLTAGLLYAASAGLIRLTRRLAASSSFPIRHAAISLGRPGSQTRVILMAVGLGCFFIIGVRATQVSLLADLTAGMGQRLPDFVLIDIQNDQLDSLQQTVAPFVRDDVRITPNMRARVAAVDGQRLQLDSPEAVRAHRGLSREYSLTFRNHLEANEELVAGQFWSASPEVTAAATGRDDNVDTEVSIEVDEEEDGLTLGDVIVFDAAGVPIRARVTSVRRIAWQDPQSGGFAFVLRPSPAVIRAPHSYVGFAQINNSDAAAGGSLQRALVRTHANISVIDVRDIVLTIRGIADNVTAGVTAVGVVTLFGGVLILIGAVAMTKFQKMHETAIYRTLGAGNRLVATMLAAEYAVLGLLAGTLGAIGGAALSWTLSEFVFELDWHPAPGLLAAGVAGSAVLVSAVGTLASVDVLRRKPMAALRNE